MTAISISSIFKTIAFTLAFSGSVCGQLTETTLSRPVAKLAPIVYFDFEASPASLPAELASGNALLQIKDNDASGSPASVPGAIGQAWDFSGTTDALRFRGGPVQALGDILTDRGFSLSLWLKHDEGGTNTRVGGAGYGRQWEITVGREGGLRITIGPATLHIPQTSALADGTWHHVVATADFSTSTNNLRIYLDGTEIDAASYTYTEPFYFGRTDHPLFLGSRPNGGNSAHYQGAIDDFALFDYPLTPTDIALLQSHDGQPVTVAVPKLELGPTITPASGETLVPLSPALTNIDLSAPGTSLTWSQASGSSPVTFSDPTALSPTATFQPTPDYDSYILRLEVKTPDVTISDKVAVTFHTTKTPAIREFPALTPPGTHPRLLFTSSEIPALRTNYAASPEAQRGANFIKAALTNARASNTDYQAIAAGNTSQSISSSSTRSLFNLLANNAAVALMENDSATLTELGTALSTLAQIYLPIYEPDYDSPLANDTNVDTAYGYDLLFNSMSPPGQDATRALLAKMSRHRTAYGRYEQIRDISGNWDIYHDTVVLCALAIEGEEGYDPHVFESNVEKFRLFFNNYGIFENGFAHEGDGYLNFGFERGSMSLLATAYRDENFFATSRIYKNTLAKFRELQPWRGGSMYSHHDGQWWGTGFFTGNIFWVSQHVFPTDPIADYTAQSYAASGAEPRKNQLACVLFSRPAIAGNATPETPALAANLPLSIAEPERGLVNARSAWGEDAIRLDFECRMDLYSTGHLHSDRNMFTLSALGRQWITDQGYHETSNDMHATVLIDGIGQPCSAIYRWKAMPGIFLGHTDDGTLMTAAGDARIAYTYHNGAASNDPNDGIDNPDIPNDVEAILDTPATESFTWADFVMPGTTDIPAWKSEVALTRVSNYNAVQHAFRTVSLIRGETPYVIVVDDIQKDTASHLYEWLAPVSNDTVVNRGTIIVDSSSDTEAVLRFQSDTAPGSPRLLVRAIQADGTIPAPVSVVTRAIGVYSTEAGRPPTPYNLLSIQRETIAPNFKILLFPFRAGEPIPTSSWDGTKLTIPSTGDEITFTTNPQNRTELSLTRANHHTFPSTSPGSETSSTGANWIEYSLGGNGGTYDIALTYSAPAPTKIQLTWNNTPIGNQLLLTPSATTRQQSLANLQIPDGVGTLRITTIEGSLNLQQFEISPSTTASSYQAWRTTYPALDGSPGNPTQDADADGMTNLMEFATLSNPSNPDDAATPEIIAEMIQIKNNPTATGIDRFWLRTNDFTTWETIPVSPTEALSPNISLPLYPTLPRQYYRYRVTLE